MYKKFLAAALAVTMVLGLAGCGGSGGSTQAASSQEKESSAAPAGFHRGKHHGTGRGCRRTGCD
ncbi:MAG: hypothetical protein ACLTBV_10550 [Enterocloster bolteae]